MNRFLLIALFALFSVSVLSACNTISGAGEDVQSAGKAVEDVAEDCQDDGCVDNQH